MQTEPAAQDERDPIGNGHGEQIACGAASASATGDNLALIASINMVVEQYPAEVAYRLASPQ
jgi:hypothetical protein